MSERMSEQPYINTMDVYPLEAAEQNKLYKFYDSLREGRLTTTKCTSCGHIPWPPRTLCPNCTSDEFEWIDLPRKARIYSCTVQTAGVPPVFEIPLYMAMVEFDNGLRMLTRLVETTEDDLEIGREVELAVLEVPGPMSRVVHAFKPVRGN
ncbi:MAG: Zn-ribbon domain-containing OB-fold protein [Chloroflexi bacterium]|nr:Zn-ribbon domain-containing OB-fold protein [Chloroflexota bacterium]